jgi:alpha-L-fucosidase 2
MFDAHPPFQIDGNFGTCSGIAEMFVQGYRGNLLLLPALPAEWRDGHMYGLRAPGGLTVDIDFAGGRLKLARIYADHDLPNPVRVVCGDRVKYVKINAGRTCELRADSFN